MREAQARTRQPQTSAGSRSCSSKSRWQQCGSIESSGRTLSHPREKLACHDGSGHSQPDHSDFRNPARQRRLGTFWGGSRTAPTPATNNTITLVRSLALSRQHECRGGSRTAPDHDENGQPRMKSRRAPDLRASRIRRKTGAVHEPPLHQPQITRSHWYDHWPCRDDTNVGAVREPPQILTKRVLFESKMSKVQTCGHLWPQAVVCYDCSVTFSYGPASSLMDPNCPRNLILKMRFKDL